VLHKDDRFRQIKPLHLHSEVGTSHCWLMNQASALQWHNMYDPSITLLWLSLAPALYCLRLALVTRRGRRLSAEHVPR
jgi:hypothetical protein